MVDYYENSAISQSQLKLLLGGNPGLFNAIQEPERYFEEKEHFIIGSGVDCLLTTPYEFSDKYYVSTLETKPSDTIKSILKQTFDFVYERNFGLIDDLILYSSVILSACVDHNFGGVSWTDGTKLHKILEHRDYFDELKYSNGKTILSIEEKTKIDLIVMSLRTNEVTSTYFQNGNIIYQLAIYFTYADIACKALLDMVITDEENKTIQPIDIKTMGDSTLRFHSALKKRRYDIQAAYYTEALEKIFPDYTILPFKFLVESTINPGTPLVYTCTQELLHVGKYGILANYTSGIEANGTIVITGKNENILGFHDLIQLYKYYLQHGFIQSKIIRDNNSELLIDWYGIIN